MCLIILKITYDIQIYDIEHKYRYILYFIDAMKVYATVKLDRRQILSWYGSLCQMKNLLTCVPFTCL